MYIWHQYLPSIFDSSLSWSSIAFLLLRALAIVGVSSAVIWRRVGEPDFSLSQTDYLLILLLAAFMCVSAFLDRARGRTQSRALVEDLEQDICMNLARVIDKMSEFIERFSKQSAQDVIQEQLGLILQCMDRKIRIYLQREDRQYFNVTLLVFSGTDGGKLAIKERARRIRKLTENLDATQSAAYYVAKMQNVKVIHDFRKSTVFPVRGLSQSDAPYRSILLLPLEPVTVGSSDSKICRGIVSIDSEHPYEFWGTATTDIEIQMRPYLSVLNLMLTEQADGVPVER